MASVGETILSLILDKATMTAMRQQQLAKTTSWLAQLKANARWAGFDLPHIEQSAKERYCKPLDELTVEEAQTLAWEYANLGSRKAEAERAARTPINGPHYHPCLQREGALQPLRLLKDCGRASLLPRRIYSK
jgi:hypothetical protein